MSKLNVNALVQNENEQIVQEAILEFGGFVRKTAQNVIEMGRIVYETKEKLGKDKAAIEMFFKQIGFNSKSKSVVKLGQIGKLHNFLKNHADSLPESWTTLYEITLLGEKKIAEFIEQGVIHKFVLGDTIKLLSKSKSVNTIKNEVGVTTENKEEAVQNGTLNGYSFLCELDNVGNLVLKSQLKMILKNLQDLKVKVEYSPKLKSVLNTEHLKAA